MEYVDFGALAMTGRILVTGAGGFFGRVLVPVLREIAQVIEVRRNSEVDSGSELIRSDLSDLPDLMPALCGVDCVVHCAALAHIRSENLDDPLQAFMRVNCVATLHLARQCADVGVRRLVFLSSIGVNGDRTSGMPFQSDDEPAPHSPYAVSKLAAEEGLIKIAQETGLEVVIIRSPLIIGPNPVGNLKTLSSFMKNGLPLPFGFVTNNRRSVVFADVLADFVRICVSHPDAPGPPLLVANKRPLSTREIVERLAEISGQKARLFPVPVSLLYLVLVLAGRRTFAVHLLGDLEVDISQTSARLSWYPRA